MAYARAEASNDSRRPAIIATLAGAAAVLLAGAPLIFAHDFGPLSLHMAAHIVTMNIAAPVAAALLVSACDVRESTPRYLWIASAVQVLALWFLHTPRFHLVAAHSPAAGLAMHWLLAGLAFLFWLALLSLRRPQRWHAPAALLLTGKLACLLAALLIFSPRLLYAVDHGAHVHHSLGDQHLSGLLMIVACPLSYLTVAVLLTLDLVGPHADDRAQPSETQHAP